MSKSKRAMTQEGRAGRPASEPSLIPLSPESARPSTLLANKGFRRILSARRFVVILSTFLLSLLVGLGTLSFLLVGQIFAQLTPATARDLAWKAERGVAELSFTTELGVVLAEEERLEQAAHTYLADEDVRALLIRDIDKKVLFSYPSSPAAFDELFLGRPLVPHETAEAFSAWSPIEIEGAEVGSVGLSVSKARLLAGDDLRFRILATTSVGAVIALILSAFFVSLYIAPLIRLTERAFFDLEQRTQEALDSARLKSEFLANMSHEIRTPMNGIIGMADLLKKTSLSDKQRRYTRTITASASALLTIINDILDFSKIEAGKLAVRPTETDVRHLAEEVTQLHAAPGQLKSIEVMCVVAPDVPRMLMADHDRLRQVLNNIMSNAVKFTQHGSVVMRVWVQERSVGAGSREVWRIGFSVTDTGIGIASEDHERVFELFSQVDGSLTRTRGGTGLGLSISRHLVGLMGGHLRMTSELDQGSCFEFALPLEVRDEVSSIPSRKLPPTLLLSQPGAQLTVIDEILDLWGVPTEKAYQAGEALDLLARRHRSGEQFGLILCEDGLSGVADFAQRVRDESLQPDARLVLLARMSSPMRDGQYFDDTLPMPPVDDDLRRVVLGSSSRRSDPTDERGLRRFVDRPRLLVAEDNVINREVMREMLHTLKLDADLVEDGKQALEAIERSHYPLILMDCQMPLMDGYEATKCIRARTDEKRHVPIIAVTATALLSERDKAFAAGMNDYVTKPVLIARLTQALSPFLKSAPGPASLGVPHPAPGPDTPLAESRPTTPSNRPKDNPPQREALARRGSEPAAEPHLHPGTRRSPAVATLFRRMIPDQLELLEQAISLRDAAEVKRVAHKLKGSCLALGARQMAALCAQLEPLPTDAQVRLVALRHEHQAVLEALASEGNS